MIGFFNTEKNPKILVRISPFDIILLLPSGLIQLLPANTKQKVLLFTRIFHTKVNKSDKVWTNLFYWGFICVFLSWNKKQCVYLLLLFWKSMNYTMSEHLGFLRWVSLFWDMATEKPFSFMGTWNMFLQVISFWEPWFTHWTLLRLLPIMNDSNMFI